MPGNAVSKSSPAGAMRAPLARAALPKSSVGPDKKSKVAEVATSPASPTLLSPSGRNGKQLETGAPRHFDSFAEQAEKVELSREFASQLLSADQFDTVVAYYDLLDVFQLFSPERIDKGKAIPFDAVSLKDQPGGVTLVTWRKVAIEADLRAADVKMFDLDKKVFLTTHMDLIKAPSLKASSVRHYTGKSLGAGRKPVGEWDNFVTVWLEERQYPITLISNLTENIMALTQVLCLIQAYKLRLIQEADWSQRMDAAISADALDTAIDVHPATEKDLSEPESKGIPSEKEAEKAAVNGTAASNPVMLHTDETGEVAIEEPASESEAAAEKESSAEGEAAADEGDTIE